MFKDWEKELKNEIKELMQEIDAFKKKWDYSKLEDITKRSVEKGKPYLDKAQIIKSAEIEVWKDKNVDIEMYWGVSEHPEYDSAMYYAYTLCEHATEEEVAMISECIKDYSRISINPIEKSVYTKCPHLMLLAYLIGFGTVSINYLKFDKMKSKLFEDKINNMYNMNFGSYLGGFLDVDMFKDCSNVPFHIRSNGENYLAYTQFYVGVSGYSVDVLNNKFFDEVNKYLDSNKYRSIIGLAKEIFFDFADKDNERWMNLNNYIEDSFDELEKEYLLTPEEILISDQRYYNEKRLENDTKRADEDRSRFVQSQIAQYDIEISRLEENRRRALARGDYAEAQELKFQINEIENKKYGL